MFPDLDWERSGRRDRWRRFYPGGNIVDYFRPAHGDGRNIMWEDVTDRASLQSLLEGNVLIFYLAGAVYRSILFGVVVGQTLGEYINT